jgi:hypothetical protein
MRFMYAWTHLPLILWCLTAGGCARPAQRIAAAPVPAPKQADPPAGRVIDREEDLWPDPRERTYARLSNLQFLIAEFAAKTGDLPHILRDALPGEPGPAFTRDAWDNEITYTRHGAEYELRAPGPDTRPNSPDDLVLTRYGSPPRLERDAAALTRIGLQSAQTLVLLYAERTGELPEKLESLDSVGLRPYLGVIDAWGNAFLYTRRGNGFEIRSAGADGANGSADDVVVTHNWSSQE